MKSQELHWAAQAHTTTYTRVYIEYAVKLCQATIHVQKTQSVCLSMSCQSVYTNVMVTLHTPEWTHHSMTQFIFWSHTLRARLVLLACALYLYKYAQLPFASTWPCTYAIFESQLKSCLIFSCLTASKFSCSVILWVWMIIWLIKSFYALPERLPAGTQGQHLFFEFQMVDSWWQHLPTVGLTHSAAGWCCTGPGLSAYKHVVDAHKAIHACKCALLPTLRSRP